METFGARLARLRNERGITQATLAAAAGVPIGTLRNWEHDRREPLIGVAAKLARALKVSVDELVGNGGQEAAPPAAKPKRKSGK
jgi:transcriptional regulator with XRE-family HTH domain